jgi:predicted ATP-dependent endonuclease of OLD family
MVSVTKEIFFSDKILFVEGQEDVGLIKNWLRIEYEKNQHEEYNYSFEIFGYGAGGVDNIPKFLDMAKDLGIKKVGVLTDELPTDKSKNFTTWKENFNTECNYKFQELTTLDIRKKNNIDVDKFLKECVNQETGKLRDSDTIIDDVNECIISVNSGYFLESKIIKCSNCEHTEPLIDITKCNSDCKHASLMKIFNEFNKYFDDKTYT